MKNVTNECMGIATTSTLPKHTCSRKGDTDSLLGWVFMLSVEICLVSLNGIGKQDETHHKLKIEASMEKQIVLLDS